MQFKYKAIIFDFDGVILDSVDVKTEAFRKMYSSYGTEIAERVVEHHLINGGISRYVKIRFYQEELLGVHLSDEELDSLADRFSELVFDEVLKSPFIIGAHEFLKKYHQMLPLFIATGTPKVEIDKIISLRGLGKYFNTVYGSPTLKPEIIATILEGQKLSSREVIFVGDAPTDYEAAIQMDVDFVGIRNDRTTFGHNVVVIDDLMKLSELL